MQWFRQLHHTRKLIYHAQKVELLKENLAECCIRKKSISHDKLSKKLKSHYDLFHMSDEKKHR